MPAHYIDCPNCGLEVKLDEPPAGQDARCAGCGTTFEAEVGGAYDLADAPKSKPARPEARRPEGSRPAARPTDSEEPEPAEENWKSWLEEWPSE